MLKFVFWALVAANAALFAYREGYLGPAGAEEHEPARLKNQLAGERMVLLTAAEAKAAADSVEEEQPAQAEADTPAPQPEPVAAAAPPAPPSPAPQLVACVQAGPFSTADARRFESRVNRLNLDARPSRVETPFQEVTSRLVYLPPNGGREGAQRRAAELKELGVSNFFIMQGDSPLRYAISLGVFKTQGAAQKLAADLGRQGVRGVRILPRGPQTTRTAFQYRRIDAAARTRIAGIADDFSGAAVQNCD
ncbi:SPOR domain-containing protein [Massilia sp.]|uniref:SPOR domain-containing protein n=1 Tax=Massilia sp. TaxID=1882437 RepID=UPI00289C679B|nr:SPOR domain-containing protein [Massilia sp.]